MAFVDSHTEGEPTRVVDATDWALPPVCARELRDHLAREHAWLRAHVVDEPRGSAALVGVVLAAPVRPDTIGRVVFLNNVGYLPMCVHATIGMGRTLAHLGRIADGPDSPVHVLDTPAGDVGFRLLDGAMVEVENVPGRRVRTELAVETSRGRIVGDVAWGGNWFFIAEQSPLQLTEPEIPALTELAAEIRRGLTEMGVRGDDGAEIDHVQLCGPPRREDADARNFVLCPGGVHDRSPCGTGTSARVACLAEQGRLAPGEVWRQESITGSLFHARYRRRGDELIPSVTGRAFVTAQGRLLREPGDPLGGVA